MKASWYPSQDSMELIHEVTGVEIRKIYRAGCFLANKASETSGGRETPGASS